MRNAIVSTNDTKPLTMSSREIAELVCSRHDKVKQSIKRLAERGVITFPPMGETSFTDKIGKKQWVRVYHLGERDSYIVVAQLSPEFTAQLVDRWRMLERAVELVASQIMMRDEFEEMKAAIARLEKAMPRKYARRELSEEDKDINKIKKILKKYGGKTKHSHLLRSLSHSIKAKRLKELIQNMIEAERLEKQEVKTKGRPSLYYKLMK